jgi:ketosteroid isomerase-like protein
MSRENVEIVQAFYAAFDQGDEAAMRAILDVEVEWIRLLGSMDV